MKFTAFFTAAFAVATISGSLLGAAAAASNDQSQSDLASQAASVLQRQMSFPPNDRIPAELVGSARCIAVFPSVVQGGFIIGAKRGEGLVSCRQSDGDWSNVAPAVYSLTGGSIGLQAGVQESTVVLLFMTDKSAKSLLESQFELGAGLEVTAGPLGLDANVTGSPSPVVAYVTSQKGLFAGVNLSGSKLSFDQDENARIYGEDAGPQDILFTQTQVPSTVSTFVQTVQEFSPS